MLFEKAIKGCKKMIIKEIPKILPNQSENVECNRNNENIFDVVITDVELENCVSECNKHLATTETKTELGGVIIGTFDGSVLNVKHFLFDHNAKLAPGRITLSTNIFRSAEEEIKKNNGTVSSKIWSLIGTWHTHPYDSMYSSTDEATLFRDKMRIITDDPSLVSTPWVHIIFDNYGTNKEKFRVFTMRVSANYRLDDYNHNEINEKLIDKSNHDLNLGLIVSKLDNEEMYTERYHPNFFEMHKKGEIKIHGLWKRYPFEKISTTFENIFFENFFQKIGLEDFIYARVLQDTKVEWFTCKRTSIYNNTHKIVDFDELKVQIEKSMKIKFQNPDLGQTIDLNLSEESKVSHVAKALQQKLNIRSPPNIYAYLQKSAVESLKGRARVDGDRVDLPDDISLSYVLNNIRDPETPIYFETLDTSEEKLFYLRTYRFSQAGYDISRLKKSKVFIAGAGLLGSEIATNLATLGVGNIFILDNGSVDFYNVYRQPIYSKECVYEKKVDVAKSHLEKMGGLNVTPLLMEIPSWSSKNREDFEKNIALIDKVIEEVDIVIAVFDKFSPRAVLQFMCLIRNRPFVVAALQGSFGYTQIFENADDGCYCCDQDPREYGSWNDGGACTLSSLEGQKIITSLATKIIVDKLEDKEIEFNKIEYNARTMELKKIKRSSNPRCSLCGSSGIIHTVQDEFTEVIIDYLFSPNYNQESK